MTDLCAAAALCNDFWGYACEGVVDRWGCEREIDCEGEAKLDACDDHFGARLLGDGLAGGAFGRVVDRADAGAWETAALRAVLSVREHRRRGAGVDLDRHRLRCWRSHRRWRCVWLWTREDQFLNGGDLLAVVVFLQRDELRFHVFHKGFAFSTLELAEEFLCFMLDAILQGDRWSYESRSCRIDPSS